MNHHLEEIFTDIERIEPFSPVAVALLEMSFQPSVSAEDVAELVETDVGLTTKVLRLANSAMSGARREILSVKEAGIRLGVRTVAQLAMTSGARSFFMGMGSSTPRSNRGLWEESLTSALASQALAAREKHAEPELVYTVGLLQNMGHVVMDRFLDRLREDVLALVDDGMSMLAAEKKVFGMHHGEIGARIVSKWDMPSPLVDGIRFHHEPDRARIDPVLCALTNIAEAVTWSMLGEPGEQSMCYGVSGGTLRMIGASRQGLDEIKDDVRARKAELSDLLAA